MQTRFGKTLRAIRRARRTALVEVAGPMDWTISYLSMIERGKSRPPAPRKIADLARILGAEDQLPELLDLAARERGTLVFTIDATVDPEAARALLELSEAFRGGRLDAATGSRIREALRENTAAA